jgi:MarR family transcriptional regulator, temperature-dependent positive regulator of motility
MIILLINRMTVNKMITKMIKRPNLPSWATQALDLPLSRPHATPGHLARRFHQICVAAVNEVVSEEGLVPTQYALLVAIERDPGIDQRRLGERIGIDRTNTGKLLDQLDEMGLVERREDPSDRRVRLLRLTQRGLEMRERLQRPVYLAEDRILAPLTSDAKVTLLKLLTQVVEANGAYARPGGGRRRRGARSS